MALRVAVIAFFFMYVCGGSDGGKDGAILKQEVGIGWLPKMVHSEGGESADFWFFLTRGGGGACQFQIFSGKGGGGVSQFLIFSDKGGLSLNKHVE